MRADSEEMGLPAFFLGQRRPPWAHRSNLLCCSVLLAFHRRGLSHLLIAAMSNPSPFAMVKFGSSELGGSEVGEAPPQELTQVAMLALGPQQ